MEPIIRDFRPDDAEETAAMVGHTIDESYKWVYPEPVRQLFKMENTPGRIIEMANIGCVLVAVDPDDADKIIGTGALINGRIQSFFVHPEYRGNGIGLRLMEKLEDRATAIGLKTITLSSSISSRNFFQKLAYKGTPRIEKLRDGTEYIVYDMVKDF